MNRCDGPTVTVIGKEVYAKHAAKIAFDEAYIALLSGNSAGHQSRVRDAQQWSDYVYEREMK